MCAHTVIEKYSTVASYSTMLYLVLTERLNQLGADTLGGNVTSEPETCETWPAGFVRTWYYK